MAITVDLRPRQYSPGFDTLRVPSDTGAVAVAHLFEERSADPAGRRAALAAAVERLAARTHQVRPLDRGSAAGQRLGVVPGEWGVPAGSAGLPGPVGPTGLLSPVGPVDSPGTVNPAGPVNSTGPVEGRDPIALLEPLAALVPGGVRRGEALSLAGARHPGGGTEGGGAVTVDYLALALLAGALRQGLWCAAVGARALGGAALAGLLGAHAVRAGALQRLLVVAEPGERWAEVSAVLADGVDLVLLSPPGAVSPQVARRVDARLRQGAAAGERHRAALLVLGPWPSARTVLRVDRLGWSGLGTGTGRLLAGKAVVTAEDRARRVRTARVWLPADEGGLAPLAPPAADRVVEPVGPEGVEGRDGKDQTRRLTAVA